MDLLLERCPFYVAGVGLGLLVVALLWAANRPFGATGGFIDLSEWLRRPRARPGWRVFLFAGIFLGGLLFALASGGLKPTFSYGRLDQSLAGPLKAAYLALGGGLIGFGASKARGCTSGHGICGVSLGSPMSLVATATFMATAVGVAHLLQGVLP